LNEAVPTSPVLVSGFETFYTVIKILGTIGILAFFIIVGLIILKAYRIRRGLDD
jgi:hypothetical protein